MSAIKQADLLTRYLLGKVSSQEREQIEARYIEDEDFFTELQLAEDDIIDAYVNNQLSASDHELFQKHFLNSQRRRERVRSACALRAFVRQRKEPAVQDRISAWQRVRAFFRLDYSILQWVLVAGLVVAVVAGGWLLVEVTRLRSKLTDAQTTQVAQGERVREMSDHIQELNRDLDAKLEQNEKLEQEKEQARQEIARLEKRASANSMVSEGLGVGDAETKRGNGPPEDQKTISLPKNAETVRLQLDLLKDEYRRYLVVLKNTQRKEIWHDSFPSTKTANGKSVFARLPARILAKGDYRLILSGVTEQNEKEVVSEFSFRIVGK